MVKYVSVAFRPAEALQKSLIFVPKNSDVTGIHVWTYVVGLAYTKGSFASRTVVFGTVRFIRKDSYLAHL